MPEGPLVRKFHHLVSPFVGQQVVKTGGSSRKLEPASVQSLWLQDAQVHGKKLFLRFDPDEETGPPGNSPPPEPPQKDAQKEGAADPRQAQEPCGQKTSDGSSRIWVNEFSRAKKANKRGDWRDPAPRLVLHFGGGGFLAFYNCQMSWSSSPAVTPTCDILSEKFHRGQALEALGQAQPVCYTLLDQKHFSGLGNIIKNEVLYRAGIHPLSLGSVLSASQREALVDGVVEFSAAWLQDKLQGHPQHTQVYQKEWCPAGHQLLKEAFGPPGGFQRLTWWCPQCQPQLSEELEQRQFS
ncbi:endonuclease 8-like 2 isoform X2 [Callithrix jacchus]|uniref:endonuclease 8-like 2 isoform X2 n=1 Tax=Callithrix jacchus TaxID=9483 RepID=UPI00159E2C9D|nr:endonuclease 8-like 2 isoform X2 [Callithrix jacchus]